MTCNRQEAVNPQPFLSLPTSCNGPLLSTVEGDTWTQALERQAEHLPAAYSPSRSTTSWAERLQPPPVRPADKVTPDNQAASGPSGLNVDVHVPQEG